MVGGWLCGVVGVGGGGGVGGTEGLKVNLWHHRWSVLRKTD